jgi:hypothetical protein
VIRAHSYLTRDGQHQTTPVGIEARRHRKKKKQFALPGNASTDLIRHTYQRPEYPTTRYSFPGSIRLFPLSSCTSYAYYFTINYVDGQQTTDKDIGHWTLKETMQRGSGSIRTRMRSYFYSGGNAGQRWKHQSRPYLASRQSRRSFALRSISVPRRRKSFSISVRRRTSSSTCSSGVRLLERLPRVARDDPAPSCTTSTSSSLIVPIVGARPDAAGLRGPRFLATRNQILTCE